MVDWKMRGLWLRRTSRRLSVQYSLLYMGLVLVIFLFAYFVARYEMGDLAKDLMRDDAASLQVVLDEGDLDSLRVGVDALSRLIADRTRIFGLFDEAGNAIAGKLDSVPDVRSRTGQGLAMVRAIANGHWATVTLHKFDLGLCVTVSGLSSSGVNEAALFEGRIAR